MNEAIEHNTHSDGIDAKPVVDTIMAETTEQLLEDSTLTETEKLEVREAVGVPAKQKKIGNKKQSKKDAKKGNNAKVITKFVGDAQKLHKGQFMRGTEYIMRFYFNIGGLCTKARKTLDAKAGSFANLSKALSVGGVHISQGELNEAYKAYDEFGGDIKKFLEAGDTWNQIKVSLRAPQKAKVVKVGTGTARKTSPVRKTSPANAGKVEDEAPLPEGCRELSLDDLDEMSEPLLRQVCISEIGNATAEQMRKFIAEVKGLKPVEE